MIKNTKLPLIIALFILIYTNISMALEEPKFQILKSNNNYEIREYSDRLAVEVTYSNQDSGFRYLFNLVPLSILIFYHYKLKVSIQLK